MEKTQIANLAMLGKVWGFLKHHHPAIAAGKRHWDYDLFRVLPRVLKAYTAMAFRSAPNATVVGSTTAGADDNVSRVPLPGGLSSMISGIGVFYPDRKPTQRIGIIPDIEARPTIEGIRSGRDEVVEAALRHILGPGTAASEIERMARR